MWYPFPHQVGDTGNPRSLALCINCWRSTSGRVTLFTSRGCCMDKMHHIKASKPIWHIAGALADQCPDAHQHSDGGHDDDSKKFRADSLDNAVSTAGAQHMRHCHKPAQRRHSTTLQGQQQEDCGCCLQTRPNVHVINWMIGTVHLSCDTASLGPAHRLRAYRSLQRPGCMIKALLLQIAVVPCQQAQPPGHLAGALQTQSTPCSRRQSRDRLAAGPGRCPRRGRRGQPGGAGGGRWPPTRGLPGVEIPPWRPTQWPRPGPLGCCAARWPESPACPAESVMASQRLRCPNALLLLYFVRQHEDRSGITSDFLATSGAAHT